MSRMKSILAVLVLTAIVGIVPQVQAQTLKVVIAGSSAMWQTLALGAYSDGTCSTLLTGCVSGCRCTLLLRCSALQRQRCFVPGPWRPDQQHSLGC